MTTDGAGRRSSWLLYLLIVGGMAAALALFYFGQQALVSVALEERVAEGRLLSDLPLRNAVGGVVSLKEHLPPGSDVTLLVFILSNCAACDEEVRGLEAMIPELDGHGVGVLLVYHRLPEWEGEHAGAFPVLYDPNGREMRRRWNVKGLPYRVLVDGDLRVIWTQNPDWEEAYNVPSPQILRRVWAESPEG